MARLLDQKQKEELVGFLDELYRLGGYTTQKQWADDANYPPPNLSNALNRKRPDGVDGYTLLKLMRAAAVRAGTTPGTVARRSATAGRDDETSRRLRAVEEGLTELASLVRLGLDAQGVLESAQPQPETSRAGREG